MAMGLSALLLSTRLIYQDQCLVEIRSFHYESESADGVGKPVSDQEASKTAAAKIPVKIVVGRIFLVAHSRCYSIVTGVVAYHFPIED